MGTSRIRVKDDTETRYGYHYVTRNGMGTSTDGSSVMYLHGNYARMEDTVTKDFRRQSASGAVVNNPLLSLKAFNEASPGKVSWSYRYNGVAGRPVGEYWTGYWDFPIVSASGRVTEPVLTQSQKTEIDNFRSSAITESLAKVRRPEFQGAVALAEAHKTSRLLADALGELRKAVQALRSAAVAFEKKRIRQGFKRFKDLHDATSSMWLLGRYGVMPTIYDVQDLLRALRKVHSARETVRAKVHANLLYSTTHNSVEIQASAPLGGIAYVEYDTNDSIQVEVRASVMSQYDSVATSDFGLSLLDTPAALWELMPWSFVVDWIINVGDYIDSLHLAAQRQHLCRSVTVTTTLSRQRVTTGAFRGPMWNNDWTVRHDAASMDYIAVVDKRRTPFDASDRRLVWQPRLTSLRLIDAYALLNLQLKKFGSRTNVSTRNPGLKPLRFSGARPLL